MANCCCTLNWRSAELFREIRKYYVKNHFLNILFYRPRADYNETLSKVLVPSYTHNFCLAAVSRSKIFFRSVLLALLVFDFQPQAFH